ncbi:MAG TPA: hypothetical protein VNQ73_21975 [Ilumatobacter sp.]|nr:hypothetical protein [Ilumatobacter sp.]
MDNNIEHQATKNAATTTSSHRTRWAAFGAAVAVSLGAGGLGLVSATAPDGASTYVPISPCRLADTRADSNIGPYSAPLGADQTYTFDGWGDGTGDCDLPTGTTGLQLNVTAVGATQLTNLRFFPAGQATPTVSNLNPAPGQPPTPNAVTVTLNTADGKFDVFNRFGQVDVVIDVAGYYGDHQHTGADIVDSSITRVDIADEPGLASNAAPNPNPIGILDTLVAVDLHAPASGHVTVSASAVLDFPNDATIDRVSCLIANGTSNVAATLEQIVTEPAQGAVQSIQVTRSFPVEAAGEVTYSLICGTPVGDAIASQAFITATYVPTWRGDVTLNPFPVGPIGEILDPGL